MFLPNSTADDSALQADSPRIQFSDKYLSLIQNETLELDIQLFEDENHTQASDIQGFDVKLWEVDRTLAPWIYTLTGVPSKSTHINSSSIHLSKDFLYTFTPGDHELMVRLHNSTIGFSGYFYLNIIDAEVPPPRVTILNVVNGSKIGGNDRISFSINDTIPILKFEIFVNDTRDVLYYGRFTDTTSTSDLYVANNGSYIEFREGWPLYYGEGGRVLVTIRAQNELLSWGSTSVLLDVDALAPVNGTLDQVPTQTVSYGSFSQEVFELHEGGELQLSWSYPNTEDIAYYLVNKGDTLLNTTLSNLTIVDDGSFTDGVVYNYQVKAVDHYGNVDNDGIIFRFIYRADQESDASVTLLLPILIISLIIITRLRLINKSFNFIR